jgi:hypothetical protein
VETFRQFSNAYGEYVHLCTADHEPKVLEEPTDLVLEISLNLDEQSSADEKSLDIVTVEVFNAHPLVPSALHNTRDADSVVAIALVDFSAALACLASMQMIGNRILLNSVHSHVDVGPASRPMRATCGACDLTNAAMSCGCDATVPSRMIFPV